VNVVYVTMYFNLLLGLFEGSQRYVSGSYRVVCTTRYCTVGLAIFGRVAVLISIDVIEITSYCSSVGTVPYRYLYR
jgi:hypothetical protein